MKRIPVTQASYKKIESSHQSPKGSGINIVVGKPDTEKSRQAAFMGWGGFRTNGIGRPSMLGSGTSFYNNSYMSGGRSGGLGDIPAYIAYLNDLNGGILYFPTTLKEKFEFYRFFWRFNPFVSAAVNLNTDLPMSRLQLRMPKMEDKRLSKRIQKFYDTMVDEIHLFDRLHSMLFENCVIGNCFIFCEFSEEKKRWDKLTILPPEEIEVANYPMSDMKRIVYRPEMLNSILSKYDMPLESYEEYQSYIDGLPDDEKSVLDGISYEFVKQIKEHNGCLSFDTDPYKGDNGYKIGSFVFHFANKRHDYQDWGVSPLECVLVPLLQQLNYQYTQLTLSSRNMTPRNLIVAEGISEEALMDLREQVDMSMLSPDYSIVTNYDVRWDTIGADQRLIDLQKENETIENQLFAGLGVTRELLTGEGMYSGNKITIEILNTRYLLMRECLQRFVEESLFKPVALQNGFYKDDEDGNREWFYPHLGFTRLTIRDNAEVFDSLFQLYQKGSLPIRMILDIFNINSDEVDEELKSDMFTPRDATYNEMLRQAYSSLGDHLIDETDLVKQLTESITGPSGKKLRYTGEVADEASDDDVSLRGGISEDDTPAGFIDHNQPNPFAMDMIDRSGVPGGTPTPDDERAKIYIDNFKHESLDRSNVTSDDSSNDSDDKEIDDYINNFLGDEKKKSDENANKYIDGFLGNNGNDSSSEAQNAGIDNDDDKPVFVNDTEVEDFDRFDSDNDVAEMILENRKNGAKKKG